MSKTRLGTKRTLREAARELVGTADPKMAPFTRRKVVDWKSIEPFYRTGILSLKEIGDQFGVSDAAIIKHARGATPPWTRDLKARVMAKAQDKAMALLVSAEVSDEKRVEQERLAAPVVEASADAIAGVRLRHRRMIERCQKLYDVLFAEMEEFVAHRQDFGTLAESLRSSGGSDAKRSELVAKVIAFPETIKLLNDLAGCLSTLVAMERRLFRLDEAPEPSPPRSKNVTVRFVEAPAGASMNQA